MQFFKYDTKLTLVFDTGLENRKETLSNYYHIIISSLTKCIFKFKISMVSKQEIKILYTAKSLRFLYLVGK